MVNGSEIVALLENNGVEIWMDGGRLFARWNREGVMPEGADMFIRRFRDVIIATLVRRDANEEIAA